MGLMKKDLELKLKQRHTVNYEVKLQRGQFTLLETKPSEKYKGCLMEIFNKTQRIQDQYMMRKM